MIFWIFFLILSLIVEVYLWWKLQASLIFWEWENLHNWWLTKYFFAPLYIYIYLNYTKNWLKQPFYFYIYLESIFEQAKPPLLAKLDCWLQTSPMGRHKESRQSIQWKLYLILHPSQQIRQVICVTLSNFDLWQQTLWGRGNPCF